VRKILRRSFVGLADLVGVMASEVLHLFELEIDREERAMGQASSSNVKDFCISTCIRFLEGIYLEAEE